MLVYKEAIKKPLLHAYKLNGDEKNIEYEWIHMVCFGCGIYGHGKGNCPEKNEQEVQEEKTKVEWVGIFWKVERRVIILGH